MYILTVCGLTLLLATVTVQQECSQCDCNISNGEDSKAVLWSKVTCRDGKVTWYNPTTALRLEIEPRDFSSGFTVCFVVDSGNAKLKISQEVDQRSRSSSRSPISRSHFMFNDHNLDTVITTEGRSKEHCITATERHILFLEPEITESLGYQKIIFHYDITAAKQDGAISSMEDCRPCSPSEVITAYCSSDFVVVGKMDDVRHSDDKTHIGVSVHQIVRQVGSHFVRMRRDAPGLQGSITVPRKCGVVKGDGLFLMTGRERLGELRMGCAPYFDEWESIVNKAELEGRMECSRD